ncbi:alpha-ketoglutarate-dependent sulfonate dioxygenase [Truncatella angustata]|uniref:Alpha-ketoglutarate-dependent sulfonate dioxygenase n=1 Tax=Truncatella angustata TaxID=152316 RepID=A0A9P8RIP1_9PEZI|nr:alpha-ketoglutarate-dependent sulfonate dioxygenase [Truncatella angustata]KAH6643420.1 alpha-ketoglutarate-dependent sulfonate dioxygenase [Truncatella angustata]
MAPGLTSDIPVHSLSSQDESTKTKSYPKPLRLSGALEKFKYEETTPVIGREYVGVNIVDDLLNADNADDLLRDLAITISQRGVVFFRAQDNLSNDLQKQFVHRLGQVTGKPKDSTLHIHPVLNNSSEFGVGDHEISTISSRQRKTVFKHEANPSRGRYDSAEWHSDIQFEPVPADYTSLRLTQLPSTGGDTLWASGYEIYDRFSKPYQKFFEGLTATFSGDGFHRAVEQNPNVKIYEEARGNPLNVGAGLEAVHPVVRTNPVTGWKSIFAVGPFPKHINGLYSDESEAILKKFRQIITENHDLQVRFKWRNENDIAIWDNRSAFHSATFDYDDIGERFGNRAVGIGEQPYLDPHSKSRTEALREAARR